METLAIIGSIIGLGLFFPLLSDIARDKIIQNLSTYALWAVLDIILVSSLVAQKGNYWLPAGFAIGTILAAILLGFKTSFNWSILEWIVASMTVTCMIVWYFSGPLWATVTSTAAINIAGIPQLMETWKKPDRGTLYVWIGFGVAQFLSFLGGKDWSIPERLFSGVGTIYCFIMILIIVFRRQKTLSASI